MGITDKKRVKWVRASVLTFLFLILASVITPMIRVSPAVAAEGWRTFESMSTQEQAMALVYLQMFNFCSVNDKASVSNAGTWFADDGKLGLGPFVKPDDGDVSCNNIDGSVVESAKELFGFESITTFFEKLYGTRSPSEAAKSESRFGNNRGGRDRAFTSIAGNVFGATDDNTYYDKIYSSAPYATRYALLALTFESVCGPSAAATSLSSNPTDAEQQRQDYTWRIDTGTGEVTGVYTSTDGFPADRHKWFAGYGSLYVNDSSGDKLFENKKDGQSGDSGDNYNALYLTGCKDMLKGMKSIQEAAQAEIMAVREAKFREAFADALKQVAGEYCDATATRDGPLGYVGGGSTLEPTLVYHYFRLADYGPTPSKVAVSDSSPTARQSCIDWFSSNDGANLPEDYRQRAVEMAWAVVDGSLSDISTRSGGTSDVANTCRQNGGALAWVMCPILEKINEGIQNLYQWVLDSLFRYDNIATGEGVFEVWQRFLPIANIAFAIVFMVIIYSTATSTGLSNYSVKKIMPRLVIGAILVNISFYICAAVVDLTNILGANIGKFIGEANGLPVLGIRDGLLTTALIILVVLCASGALVLGLVMIIALVAFRQVAITMLIIISPIAFVLWLLPNTEKLFKRWMKAFTQMLFVYPAVSATFGACMLVASVMDSDDKGGLLGFIIKPLLVLAPVAAIVPIMKMGGEVMGSLNKLANQAAKVTGASKYAKDKDEARRKKVQTGRFGEGVRQSRIGQIGRGRVGRVITGGSMGRGLEEFAGRVSRMGEAGKEKNAGIAAQAERDRLERMIERAEQDPGFAATVGQTRIQAARQKLNQEATAAEQAQLEFDVEKAKRDTTLATWSGRIAKAGIATGDVKNGHLNEIQVKQVLAAEAAGEGNMRRVRVIEDSLAASGAPGVDALATTHGIIEATIRDQATPGSTTTPGSLAYGLNAITADQARSRILELRGNLGSGTATGKLKEKRNDLLMLAYDTDAGRTIAAHQGAKVLNGTGAPELSTQTATGLRAMLTGAGVPPGGTTSGTAFDSVRANATEVLDNRNLSQNLNPETRNILEAIRHGDPIPPPP